MKDIIITSSIFCLLALSAGCARDLGSNVYTEDSVNQAASTYEGVVISMRTVIVKSNDKMSNNITGGLIGGLTGGVAGNMFGGGRGRVATTTIGALAGAAAGAYAEDRLTSQFAIEYVVKLKNGKIYTIVQGKDIIYAPGQNILISMNASGRPRIISAIR